MPQITIESRRYVSVIKEITVTQAEADMLNNLSGSYCSPTNNSDMFDLVEAKIEHSEYQFTNEIEVVTVQG